MTPSVPTVSLRRRQGVLLSVLLILLTAGTLTLVIALAGDRLGDEPTPAKAAPTLSQQEALEQFCNLTAEKRRQRVWKVAKDGKPFVPVTRGDLDVTITGRGQLEAVNGFDVICMVRARRQGDCIATTVRSLIPNGTEVKAGDTLITFDDSAVQKLLQAQTLRVEQALVEKAAAEKLLLLVQKKYKRAVPTPAFLLGEATVTILAKAKAAAAAQEKSLRQDLLADLRACVIKAPGAGLVAYYIPEPPRWGVTPRQTVVALGEPVSEGQKLMRVYDPMRFSFRTKIDEELIPGVKVGQRAVVRVDRSPDRVLCGGVKFVATMAAATGLGDVSPRVYTVLVELDPGLPGLVPDMKGTVRIIGDKRQHVLRLPRESVLHDGEKTVCFVKTAKGVEDRTVKIGMGNDSLVEITHGLKEGELVLRDPQGVARWFKAREPSKK